MKKAEKNPNTKTYMFGLIIISLAAFIAIILILYNSYTSSCLSFYQRVGAWLYKKRQFAGYSGVKGKTSIIFTNSPSPEKNLPTIDLVHIPIPTPWNPPPSYSSINIHPYDWRLIDANDPISVSIPSVTQTKEWYTIPHDPESCPVCKLTTLDSRTKTVKKNDRYSILKNNIADDGSGVLRF